MKKLPFCTDKKIIIYYTIYEEKYRPLSNPGYQIAISIVNDIDSQ